MPREFQMQVVQKSVNEILERAAVAAEQGGPAAVRALKIPEDGELPPKPPLAISDGYREELSRRAAEISQQ